MKKIIIIISLIIITSLAGFSFIYSIINIVNKEYIIGGFYSLKGLIIVLILSFIFFLRTVIGLIKQLKQGTN